MSSIIYLSIKGSTQGLISAGCSTAESIGNRYQLGHEDQIQVLFLKYSMTRQQNVNHHPLEFIKPIDKSTPLFGLGISNNELFESTFDFYRTNQHGYLENYFGIYLSDVTIASITGICPHSIDNPEEMPCERILLNYKSITWKHKVAATSAYSFWDDRVY